MNTNKPINTNSQLIGHLALVIIGSICSYFYLFGIPKDIFAQAKIPLVVAPARQTVAMDAGTTENLVIKFINESETAIAGNLKAVDFIVTADNGAPTLLEDMENPWIKLPYDRASIAANDVLRINYKVVVPSDAPAGGRYVAIIFEPTGQIPEATNIKEEASIVSTRIVGLVYIKINGDIQESAFINAFKIPYFLEFGPVPVHFEIINKGGYHITPTGQVTLTNWFGKEVARQTLESKNVFPNAKRNYDLKIGKTWMFGKYNVSLTSGYGEQGQVLTTSDYVWIVPVTLLVIIVLGLIIIILASILITRKIKSKQIKLEEKLEEEISELEALKNKYKDRV